MKLVACSAKIPIIFVLIGPLFGAVCSISIVSAFPFGEWERNPRIFANEGYSLLQCESSMGHDELLDEEGQRAKFCCAVVSFIVAVIPSTWRQMVLRRRICTMPCTNSLRRVLWLQEWQKSSWPILSNKNPSVRRPLIDNSHLNNQRTRPKSFSCCWVRW